MNHFGMKLNPKEPFGALLSPYVAQQSLIIFICWSFKVIYTIFTMFILALNSEVKKSFRWFWIQIFILFCVISFQIYEVRKDIPNVIPPTETSEPQTSNGNPSWSLWASSNNHPWNNLHYIAIYPFHFCLNEGDRFEQVYTIWTLLFCHTIQHIVDE